MGSGWWDLVGAMYGYGEGVSCFSEHMAWPMLFQTALGNAFLTLSLGKKVLCLFAVRCTVLAEQALLCLCCF